MGHGKDGLGEELRVVRVYFLDAVSDFPLVYHP